MRGPRWLLGNHGHQYDRRLGDAGLKWELRYSAITADAETGRAELAVT